MRRRKELADATIGLEERLAMDSVSHAGNSLAGLGPALPAPD
jgi:hypothetical protein